MSETLLNASLALALASLGMFVLGWLFSARAPARFGDAVQVALQGVLAAWLLHRWATAGRAPLTNVYESLILFAWSAGAVALLLRFAFDVRHADAPAALFESLALAYASTLDGRAGPLLPALRSNWLLVHVSASLVAYGAFALAFGESVWCLVRFRAEARERDRTADAAMRAAAVGFLFLTVGIATGAIWAKQAWGSYWGWDPKETWSLVTWLIYAAFLHLRLARGWKGTASSWFLVAGFAAVLFTFFGVTYLMEGLHSYE